MFHCVCVCVCVCERERERDVLFIHLPVSEHLGCFHVLANVNSPGVNIGVHVIFEL